MKGSILYRLAFALAAVAFIGAAIMCLTGRLPESGPLFILFFLSLAIGFRGYPALRGFSYTIVIFSAVSTALFYPHYFLSWNGFKLATLITPLIQVIMFGMGTSMSIDDFVGVVKTPRGVVIGVCSHYLIMPAMGFALARMSGLPPEIAAGIILIGCSPNGMASNVISYLAKANLALSITITAVSTLLAPIMTPLLMKWLAGAFINIKALDMMWDIVKMVIVPIGVGLLFNRIFRGRAGWLHALMPMVSMTGIGSVISQRPARLTAL